MPVEPRKDISLRHPVAVPLQNLCGKTGVEETEGAQRNLDAAEHAVCLGKEIRIGKLVGGDEIVGRCIEVIDILFQCGLNHFIDCKLRNTHASLTSESIIQATVARLLASR